MKPNKYQNATHIFHSVCVLLYNNRIFYHQKFACAILFVHVSHSLYLIHFVGLIWFIRIFFRFKYSVRHIGIIKRRKKKKCETIKNERKKKTRKKKLRKFRIIYKKHKDLKHVVFFINSSKFVSWIFLFDVAKIFGATLNNNNINPMKTT